MNGMIHKDPQTQTDRHMRAGSIRLCDKEKKSDIYRHRRRFMFLIYFCCS